MFSRHPKNCLECFVLQIIRFDCTNNTSFTQWKSCKSKNNCSETTLAEPQRKIALQGYYDVFFVVQAACATKCYIQNCKLGTRATEDIQRCAWSKRPSCTWMNISALTKLEVRLNEIRPEWNQSSDHVGSCV